MEPYTKKTNVIVIDDDVKGKQYLLKESLTKYYSVPGRINILHEIINQKTILSLRILDWLVTNYAKSKNIMYRLKKIQDSEETFTFNIFLNYKTQLKAYSKKQFDPFCRRERINFTIPCDDPELPSSIRTTIGQLNFFRWAIQNNIIEYAINNIKEIELDMVNSIKHRKGYVENTNKTVKKRGRKSKYSKLVLNNSEQFILTQEKLSSKKKRKELSISATKTFTKCNTKVIIEFN